MMWRGYVYVLRNPATSLLKIGYTTISAERRRATIASQSGIDIQLVCYWRANPADEKGLHRRFAVDRRKGEWFEHSEQIARWLRLMPASGESLYQIVRRGDINAYGEKVA